MDLDAVILGFLEWKDLTGYELKALFSKLGFLPWSGNNNQIYTTLVALEKKGLVQKKTIQQEKLPAQKRYSATESGREQLRQAVMGKSAAPEEANEFLLHLAWAGCLDDRELTDIIGQYQQMVEIELQMARENLNRGTGIETRNQREEYLWSMIGKHRLMVLQTELDWLARLRNGLVNRRDNP